MNDSGLAAVPGAADHFVSTAPFDPTSAAVGSQFPYDDNTSRHQFLFGVDAICQF